VADAQAKGGWFRREYNTIRPHRSIGYKTPREFSEECDRKNSIKDEINCGVEDAGIR
jgi:Integrase core domain